MKEGRREGRDSWKTDRREGRQVGKEKEKMKKDRIAK